MTWDDQKNINKFSRLHATFTDLEEEIHVLRREREDLYDLNVELELMDDETIMYVSHGWTDGLTTQHQVPNWRYIYEHDAERGVGTARKRLKTGGRRA